MPSTPVPLAVLTHEFYPYRGGIAVYVEETARATSAAGFGVTLWAPDREALHTKSWPFIIKPVQMSGTQSWRCRLALARAIIPAWATLGQSIVWIPEPGALLTAMYLNVLCCLPARKLVLTLYGSEILRFASRRSWHWLFQKLLNRADRIGVVSQYTRGLLEKHFHVNPEKITLAFGALRNDCPGQHPTRTEKTPGQPVVLLTVARIHPRKGQHCVLAALADLKPNSHMSIEYRIAGKLQGGEYQQRLETLAKNCRAKVHFLGEVPDADLPEQYAQADIFIMAAQQHCESVEGFGLVYLEAAAAGLPLIAHRTGGVSEAVRDGVMGILVEPGDRAGLAAAIGTLVADAPKRMQMGAAGRERVRELSWNENAKRLFAGLG